MTAYTASHICARSLPVPVGGNNDNTIGAVYEVTGAFHRDNLMKGFVRIIIKPARYNASVGGSEQDTSESFRFARSELQVHQ